MTPSRNWRGTTAEARRAERRARLLEAGLDLLSGAGEVSVRKVCRATGLTERYFYESFDGKDQFVAAVYAWSTGVFRDAIAAALRDDPPERTRAVYAAMVDAAAADPRHGRVVILGALSDAGLARQGGRSVEQVAALIGGPEGDPVDRRLNGIAIATGTWALILLWLDGRLEVGRDRLVEHLVALTESAGAARSGQA